MIRRTHAHHYAQVAGHAGTGLRGAEEARWVTVVDAEMGNLRAAHRWLVAERRSTWRFGCPEGLRYYMLFRFRDEVVGWGEASLALPGCERVDPLYAEVCCAVGEGLTARGEMAPAVALAARAVSGSRKTMNGACTPTG